MCQICLWTLTPFMVILSICVIRYEVQNCEGYSVHCKCTYVHRYTVNTCSWSAMLLDICVGATTLLPGSKLEFLSDPSQSYLGGLHELFLASYNFSGEKQMSSLRGCDMEQHHTCACMPTYESYVVGRVFKGLRVWIKAFLASFSVCMCQP